MASKLITTHELTGVRVVGGKNGTKRIGKVRRFVFHPKEKRCVGFIVKRPDLLWMFRRKDKFVSIEGYDIVDGRIAIRNVPEATDRAACKALGVNWDDCVLWVGLPVMTEDGTSLGMVGNVTFNRITGMVDTFDTTVDRAKPVVSEAAKKTGEVVNKGAYATGKQIAATKGMFSGFKEEYDKARGVKPGSDDQALAVTDEAEDEGVSAPAKPASTAPKKKTTAKKPAPKKNMFAAFKEEYDKARHDD